MVIKRKAGGRITGLSADSKPTAAAEPLNTVFEETDTGKRFYNSGTSWLPLLVKGAYSQTVFKEGSTYYATDSNGKVLSTSTTDASVPINAAINNIPGAVARGWGGRVFIYAGDYICLTGIIADYNVTAQYGVELVGEGKATRIILTPATPLTNGIYLRMPRARLADMTIYGNSNVTNLVGAYGRRTLPNLQRSDSGIIENIEFRGANTRTIGVSEAYWLDDEAAPVAGQVGFYKDGTLTGGDGATYYWRIDKCDFRSLDIGAYAKNRRSTSSFWTNLIFYVCTTGLKISTGEHNISNVYATSGNYGRYVIHFATDPGADINEATACRAVNIHGEMHSHDINNLECAVVLIDKGCSAIALQNIYAASAAMNNHEYAMRVIDRNNKPVNWDYDRNYLIIPSGELDAVNGYWYPGIQAIGKEMGNLAGCITANVGAATTYVTTVSGPTARLNTAGTINSISSWYYSNPLGTNMLRGDLEPDFNVLFAPRSTSTANVRIFMGLWNAFSAPTTTADILNAKKGAGLWVDTAVSTQWKVMHNDGVGASTLTAIAGNPTIDANPHTMNAYYYRWNTGFSPPGSPVDKATITYDDVRTTVTTNVPALTDPLGFLISIENTTAATRTLEVYNTVLRHKFIPVS